MTHEQAVPAHMQYEHIWDLDSSGPNPGALNDYLRWIADDDERMAGAAGYMQWLGIGFNCLYVARRYDDAGNKTESIQLNFYHQDLRGNEDPHGHTRLATTTWYAPEDSHQIITRHIPLRQGAPQIDGLPVVERQAVAINSVELDGRRPAYRFVELGPQLVMRQSVTRVAPLGSQTFGSTEVHNINFQGSSGVAVSVHHKYAEEPMALSHVDGLVYYKHLTREQAEQVVAARHQIAGEISRPSDLSAASMAYPPLDRDSLNEIMEAQPPETDPRVAEMLMLGAIRTVGKLASAAT